MAKGKKAKGKTRGKKANGSEDSEVGHNIRITKKAAGEFAKRYINLMTEREDELAKYKEDGDSLVEEMSDSLGVSKSVARQGLKEAWTELKREQREKDMEPDRLRDLDKLRDALGLFSDSPLGKAAIDKAASQERLEPEGGGG